jgi:hypothetical protein
MIGLVLADQSRFLTEAHCVGNPARISSVLFNKSRSPMWMMSLEGVGALDLYLAAISRNVESMNDQVALLRAAIAEREDLLRRSAANSDQEKDGSK